MSKPTMYDLDTAEGMANAIAWTEQHLSRICEGGMWMVPRSGTIVTVSHKNKMVHILHLRPDPSIRRVLKAAGWKITGIEKEI